MSAKRIMQLIIARGTVHLMIKYPGHKQKIAIVALSDTRAGHGKI